MSDKLRPSELRSCSSRQGNIKPMSPPALHQSISGPPAVRSAERRSYPEPNPPRPPGRRASPEACCPCLAACWCRFPSGSVLGCSLRHRLRDHLPLMEMSDLRSGRGRGHGALGGSAHWCDWLRKVDVQTILVNRIRL